MSVPDRSDRLPVVYFEGAVLPNEKLRYTLKKGDTLYRALMSIEEQIPVDLEKLLHGSPRSGDFELVPGDRIVIPYGTHEVFI